MITRNGHRLRPRFIRASCNSAGIPSRTLSRFKLVCPIRTASAKARCRNKCSLSSREVKSTGASFRVVTLPSAVMAKVATTKGRLTTRERPLRRDVFPNRDTKVPPTFSFGFAELVFKRHHFLFHVAQFYPCRYSARPVKEINHSPWETAKENDEETQ